MSHATSPSMNRPYGVVRVCQEWALRRSTFYAQLGRCVSPPREPAKRGPKTLYTDEVLTAHIRQVLATSPFLGEGHLKVWARLRAQGIRTSKPRVLRLMRQAGLLAPSRAPRVLGPRVHDGTITTDRPNQMWGTDATSTVTVTDGSVTVFVAIDHCTLEGVAHLEGAGQEGAVHHALLFCERGKRSDPVFPRHSGRMTPSHPGCPRQWCRLHAEPHQSPIRIKAQERAPAGIHSSPWHVVPQTTVGSRSRPPDIGTGCLAASGLAPPPFWLMTEASQSPTPRAREKTGWQLRLIGSTGSRPNPFASSQLHP